MQDYNLQKFVQRPTLITQEDYDTSGEIADFPKLDITFFEPEQVKYLEQLRKFSGKRQKKIDSYENQPVKRETFIKEYLMYLDINEQVQYNDLKTSLAKTKQKCFYISAVMFVSSLSIYLIRTPTTKGLLKEVIKSGGIGAGTGYGYFKVRQVQYKDSLQDFYLLILNRMNNRRRKQLGLEY